MQKKYVLFKGGGFQRGGPVIKKFFLPFFFYFIFYWIFNVFKNSFLSQILVRHGKSDQ